MAAARVKRLIDDAQSSLGLKLLLPEVHYRPFGSPSGNKLCIVVSGIGNELREPDNGRKLDQFVCFIDLDSVVVDGDDDTFLPISPTLHIDCGIVASGIIDAFCVLGEYLYMFESSSWWRDTFRKSFYRLHLSLLNHGSTKLELGKSSLLEKIGDMEFAKLEPVAIPTPDGKKIVVFAAKNVLSTTCVFELYDPGDEKLKKLPSIDVGWSSWRIEAYGFTTKSVLFVQFHKGGMYALDFDNPDCWLEQHTVYSIKAGRIPTHMDASYFETVEDRFCFSATAGAFDLIECVGANSYSIICENFPPVRLTFPLSQFGPSDLCFDEGNESLDYYIILLNHDKDQRECDFSNLQFERPLRCTQSSVRLLIDNCRVYLDSYKPRDVDLDADEEEITTKVFKTLKFDIVLDQSRFLCGPPFAFKIM